jgi:hypothetical protein
MSTNFASLLRHKYLQTPPFQETKACCSYSRRERKRTQNLPKVRELPSLRPLKNILSQTLFFDTFPSSECRNNATHSPPWLLTWMAAVRPRTITQKQRKILMLREDQQGGKLVGLFWLFVGREKGFFSKNFKSLKI